MVVGKPVNNLLQGDILLPLPQGIELIVHHDPFQPRAEATLTRIPIQLPEGIQKGLLHDVLRFGSVVYNSE